MTGKGSRTRGGAGTDDDAKSPVRLVGAGIGAGIVGIFVTIAVAASATHVLTNATVDGGTLVAVAMVALPVGLGLGVRYREQWPWPALVAGGLTGVFLFLRGRAFLSEGATVSYPLLFGLPGASVALGGTLGGAWVGARSRTAHELSASRLPLLARAGLIVAGGWTVIELLFGLGLARTVGTALDNTFAGGLVATIVGFPVATLFAVWYGRRAGVDRDDWGYRTTGRTVAVGLGVVRDRWGTTASTIVHATVNLASVVGLAVLVYG